MPTSLGSPEVLVAELLDSGRLQSLAKLGGAPSTFLITLPDLFRVKVKTGGESWGGTCWFSATGEVRRVLSRAGTRGWTIIEPDFFNNSTSLKVVL